MANGINVSDYLDKKKKGLIVVAKVGDDFAMSVAQFDQHTGKKARSQVVGIAKEDLEKQKESHEKSIADIEAMIADLDDLDK